MTGWVWWLIIAAAVTLALVFARFLGAVSERADSLIYAEPEPEPFVTYVPGPPETPWLVETDIAHLQALFLSRQGVPCPPVLCDEIADRRRAKAAQS